MVPIKCFIFDLDGTLVFTEHANFVALKAAFETVGLKLPEKLFAKHFHEGGNLQDIYKDYLQQNSLPHNPEQLRAIKTAKTTFYAQQMHLVEHNAPIIGLLEALSKHYKIALATSAREQNARIVLDNFGLTKLFDFMVFGDHVTRSKPDPECHKLIAKHFNARPEECLVFEDSAKGFAAAEAFGAHVCKVVA